MRIIGIDPGLTGAIAVLQEGIPVSLSDAPTIALNKSRRALVISDMVSLLQGHGPDCFAVMEEQQAMPKQHAVAGFTTGKGYGYWEAILVCLGIRHEIVRANIWKKAMLVGLDTKEKSSSRIKAGRLFPDADLGKRKDEGRSDALLLAEYGRRLMLGEEAA